MIVIEGDKIKSVGPADSASIPPGAHEIDLSKATVLPGLMTATLTFSASASTA